MHLLQAGVNLVYIRDILGHESVTATELYARVDSKQKREAIENAFVNKSFLSLVLIGASFKSYLYRLKYQLRLSNSKFFCLQWERVEVVRLIRLL